MNERMYIVNMFKNKMLVHRLIEHLVFDLLQTLNNAFVLFWTLSLYPTVYSFIVLNNEPIIHEHQFTDSQHSEWNEQ